MRPLLRWGLLFVGGALVLPWLIALKWPSLIGRIDPSSEVFRVMLLRDGSRNPVLVDFDAAFMTGDAPYALPDSFQCPPNHFGAKNPREVDPSGRWDRIELSSKKGAYWLELTKDDVSGAQWAYGFSCEKDRVRLGVIFQKMLFLWIPQLTWRSFAYVGAAWGLTLFLIQFLYRRMGRKKRK